MKKAFSTLCLVILALMGRAVDSQPPAGSGVVVVARIEGPIMPPTRDHMARALKRADELGATCLLVEMNTPGGRGDSMREIAQLFLGSRIPVVVYVTPSGARAASAGAIIGLSAHLLAMAPSTNIGAAHPVTSGGENLPTDVREKAVNDSSAFARTLAQRRHKSEALAEKIVTKSISLTETEALKEKIVDIVAANRVELFQKLNGRKVEVVGGTQTLNTTGARTEPIEPSWVEAFLLFLLNPNVALILGSIAFYGIIAEINHPGAILPGVAGGIAFILTLYCFAALSVSGTGIALLLLALVLFTVDLFAPTHGVLTAGGIVAFIFGAMMLFGNSESGIRISFPVVISLALVTSLFFGTIVTAGIQSRRKPAGSGPEKLIGETGKARTSVNPDGKVFVDGSLWQAANVGEEPIAEGDMIVIEARLGLCLQVRRAAPAPAEPIYAHAGHSPGDGEQTS